jgi:hypothetical protein
MNRRLETMAAPLLIFLIVRQSSVSFRCDCCGHAVQVKSLIPSRILEHFFTTTIGPLVTHQKTQAGKPRFSLLLFLLDKRMKKRSSDPWLNICTAYTSHVFAKLEGRLEPYGAYLVKSPLFGSLHMAPCCCTFPMQGRQTEGDRLTSPLPTSRSMILYPFRWLAAYTGGNF